eukprot:4971575-Pyramimonas_sp.AAC.1
MELEGVGGWMWQGLGNGFRGGWGMDVAGVRDGFRGGWNMDVGGVGGRKEDSIRLGGKLFW